MLEIEITVHFVLGKHPIVYGIGILPLFRKVFRSCMLALKQEQDRRERTRERQRTRETQEKAVLAIKAVITQCHEWARIS